MSAAMHNQKQKLILIFSLITFLIGCKYEDGPLFSLRSAKNRLYGRYILSKYTVDGVDSLNLFKDSLGTNFSFYYEDVYSVDVCLIDGTRNDGHNVSLVCTWVLTNDNKTYKINTASGPKGTGTFGNYVTPEWEILKLTNKEVKMKTTYNGKEYLIDLK